FELEWAGSLVDGMRALARDRHDVYLVDYHLGADSGLDLLRAATAPGGPHRPVIMLTGQGNPELDLQALEAGAADYLVKGRIDAETLARALRYAAKHARQLAELEDSRQRYRLLQVDVEPFLQQRFPHRRAALEIGHDHRDDRALRLVGAELEAERLQAAVEALGILPQVRPLVAAVHQLADRGRGRGDDARRQAGGEHVRTADQPQDLELRVVGNAEAADGADRFGERADDEIDLVDHALLLGHAAPVRPDEAHRMGLVDQHHRAVLLGN